MRRTRSYLAGLLFALLVLAALPFSGPRTVCANTALNPELRFGQTLALADFDNDGELDHARIAGDGPHNSIEIQLGLNGSSSWLHFDSRSAAPGSLLSQDIDHDGDADLIWTDLLHADAVVVWFGDGTGQFDRAGAEMFAQDYVPGGFSLTEPDEEKGEQASDDETNTPVALEVTRHCIAARAPALLAPPFEQSVLPIGAPHHTTSRGPPLLLI